MTDQAGNAHSESIDIFEQAAKETARREESEAASDPGQAGPDPDNTDQDKTSQADAGQDNTDKEDRAGASSGTNPDAESPFETAEAFEQETVSSKPTGPDERRITDIRTQTKDESRVSVFVDGEFAFGCHQDVAAKHGLSSGQRLTPEMQQDIEVDEEIVRAKQKAFNYLAHKPRTEEEVRRKLRRQDLGRRVIDEVIERLYELDYLNDEQYAADYAHNRFSNKGYGPIRIERELIERGVDRHLAEQTVAEFFEEESELQAARAQARKRWPRVAGEQDIRKQKRKLFGYLQRRGFTPGVIYRVVDELVDP